MAKKNNEVEEKKVVNEEVAPVESQVVDADVNPGSDVESQVVAPEVPEDDEKEKEKAKSKKLTKKEEEFERLVEETIRGVHGSGRERMLSLGDQYFKVQQEVNDRLRNK